jgi:hypothetical protein
MHGRREPKPGRDKEIHFPARRIHGRRRKPRPTKPASFAAARPWGQERGQPVKARGRHTQNRGPRPRRSYFLFPPDSPITNKQTEFAAGILKGRRRKGRGGGSKSKAGESMLIFKA